MDLSETWNTQHIVGVSATDENPCVAA